MNWENALNGEKFSTEAIGDLANAWGDANTRPVDDKILKPFRELIVYPRGTRLIALQTHIARTKNDQDGIDQLGGVLGAIEPRLEYGVDAVNEILIALGISVPNRRYYAEPGSGRTNVYLAPFSKPTNSHDLLSRPMGNLEIEPYELLERLGSNHQIIREDMVKGDALDAASRLKKLSNKWRIAVL